MTQERHNWLVDGSHTGNIYGSVRISGGGMAAREATEVGLIGSVAFIAKTTNRTGTGSIARVNKDQAHTCLCGFVADKRFELSKCPGEVVARNTGTGACFTLMWSRDRGADDPYASAGAPHAA